MDTKDQRTNLRLISESLGVTPEELQASLDRSNARSNAPKTSRLSEEEKRQFDLGIEEFKKVKTPADSKFLHIQQCIRSVLRNKIEVFIDEHGAKAFFRVLDRNVVRYMTLDLVVAFAMKALEDTDILISSKSLREHILTWSDKVRPLTKFPSTFETDGNELTFNRLDISLHDGPTPTWDYFIGKCGANGTALKAFVWSLLEKNDQSQQYLLLKGSGRDGKGSFARWLDKLHGGQTVGLNALNKYWPAMCVGKRIGIFNDVTKTAVVMTNEFKQITGGDKVTIEQKFEKAFSIRLDTKFILTTNRSISVIDEEAERRRAILVNIESDNTLIENYEEKLEAETSAFLFKCRRAYQELYDPIKKEIRCDYQFFESAAASYEDQNEYLFNRYFILDPKGFVTASEFYEALQYEVGHDNNRIGRFKEWLARTHKIERKKSSQNGERVAGYKGLRLKPRHQS